MPLTGGTPRPFLGEGDSTPSWSPDNTRLVYIDTSTPAIRCFSPTARARTPVRSTSRPGRGRVLQKRHAHPQSGLVTGRPVDLLRARTEPTGEMDVWRIRPSGGAPEQLTHQHAPVNFLAPLDSRTLLYVARAEDWSGPWLWALDVESKVDAPRHLGLEQYTSVSASRDGRRVVATVANPTASLWRVPLLDRLVEDRDAQPYPVPSRHGHWRPASAGRRCSICRSRPRDGRRAVAGPERTGVRSPEGRRRRLVRAARGVAGRQPCGGRRQTGGEAAPRRHVGGRHERTNAGCVHRDPGRGGPGRRGLVARRRLDRHRRHATRRGRGCSRSRWTAARRCGSSRARPSIRSGRRTVT